MLKLLKKKPKNITFADIEDFEAATLEEIKQAAINCNKWAEIKNRLSSLTRFQQKLTPKAGQTPEDVMKRRRDLEEKSQILRRRLDEIERQQTKDKATADKKFAAETWKREYANFRYSADSAVAMMHRLGIAQVPISAIPWKRCEETGVVQIRTSSGRTLTLDFSKLDAAHWRVLTGQRFAPLLIRLEAAAKIVDGKRQPIMIDGNFHGNEKILTAESFLAIMLV
jgi:hypothetical protein